jgi:superoxide dismutase
VLALDGWEHAYMIDYGTSKADYLGVLLNAIDWSVASKRFDISLRAGGLSSIRAA